MKFDKEDLDAIADAVAAKLAGKAPAASTGKAADKPADKPKNNKPADKPKDTGPKREDVLAKVKELGDAKGRDVVKNLIAKYGESFGKVADGDLGNLLADLEALEAGEGETPAGDDY